MTINGSCFCGAIRYQAGGKLRDARSCHCSMCRKAFSSAASAYAVVNSDSFEWQAMQFRRMGSARMHIARLATPRRHE